MRQENKTIDQTYQYQRDILLMTLPLYLMAFFFYGPRPLLMALAALVAAHLCDRAAAMLRSRAYDKKEISSLVFAMIIPLMLPANTRFAIVIVAVLAAVLVAKEAFGGYGHYPFNPCAVGFCVAAASWPGQVLRYPQPTNWLLHLPQSLEQLWPVWTFENAVILQGPSATLKSGGLPHIDLWDLLLGNYPGALGMTAALVIAACVVYLFVRNHYPLVAPAAFLGAAVLIAFFFPRFGEISWQSWPLDVMVRLQVVKFELLSGAMVFTAAFLVNEPVTLPKNNVSRLIYGILVGVGTMMFRYFGTFELGACFSIIIVNAVSGYFDRRIEARFAKKRGEVGAL